MEEQQSKLMRTFMLPHAMKLGGIANWPSSCPIAAQVNEYIPDLCGVPYSYLFRDDPVAMAECTLLVWEYIGVDMLVLNTDCYNFEPEAMGARIIFYKDHLPDIDRNNYFITSPDQLSKIRFHGLEGSRVDYLAKYCKAYKELSGMDTVPSFSAPWTLAANLYGLENLIEAAMEEPEFVHEFLRRIVEDFQLPFLKEVGKVIPGIEGTIFADAFASPPMVSYDLFKTFVQPYTQKLLDGLGATSPLRYSGVFGSAYYPEEKRALYLRELAALERTLFIFDPDIEKVGPEYYRRLTDDFGVPLVMGLSTVILKNESPEVVANAMKAYTLAGKAGMTPFFIGFNNIAPKTPIENIKAAVAAAEVYGEPGATADTPFEIPEVKETFEDFLKRKMADNPEGYSFKWLEQSTYSYLL